MRTEELRSADWGAAALSLVCLVVGLAWPGIAGAILFGLILSLSLVFVGARIRSAKLPIAMATDRATPFDRLGPSSPPRRVPAVVEGLGVQLKSLEDEHQAHKVPIPSSAHQMLAAEVTRRLAERHGLDVSETSDHTRIQALVSEPTWRVIRPSQDGRTSLAFRDPVALQHLPTILRDAETL